MNKKFIAFTLIEVLLSITVLGILAGVSAPLVINFQKKNDINNVINILQTTVEKASWKSSSTTQDSNWGVDIRNSTITLFKGNTYSTRDATYDETYTITDNITLSGDSEIVFDKKTGYPDSSKSLTIENSTDSYSITINEYGNIEITKN